MIIKNKNIFIFDWQKIAFLLLLSAFTVYLSLHVNDFFVPDSDFFDFRAKAMMLKNFQWPDTFKRPPLYAITIALFSAVIPGPHSELIAAELIGVLCAIFSLFLVYKIAGHFLGKWGFFVAWLWALHPSTLRMAVKPKSEILVTLFILWALYFFINKDRRAYLFAFLATLVRYEGAVLLAAIGAADFFTRGEKVKTVVYAAAACAFIVVWTLARSGGGQRESYIHYFDNFSLNIEFVKAMVFSFTGFLPLSLYKVWSGIAILLIGLGFYRLLRSHLHDALGLLLFSLGFAGMHVIWISVNYDYMVMIIWALLITAVCGILALGRKIINNVKRIRLFEKPKIIWIASSALFFVILIYLVQKKMLYSQYNVDWIILLIFMIPCAFFLWNAFQKRGYIHAFIPLGLAFLLGLAFYANSQANATMFTIRYSKAEFRRVGEWYEHHYTPGDKLAIAQPVVVAYYTSLDAEQDFIRLTELPDLSPEELHKWLENHKVSYIAWLSSNRLFETDNAWYQWQMEHRGWKNIAFLSSGKSRHGFILIKRIDIGPRWAFIYRI